MKTLLARLQEPSTWAGLSALLALAGLNMPDAKFQQIAHAISAVAGTLAMFIGEKPSVPPAPPIA